MSNVVKHHQHVFVADARADPLFRSVRELVLSEGFRSWMGMPVRDGDTRRGTLCLYWDTVITCREGLARQAQVLADLLGKHLSRRA